MSQADRPVVIFDGDCSFCNGAIRFILKHEADEAMLFAPRQSKAGQELLSANGIGPAPGTMVLIEGGKAFLRSTATLRICRHLRWPWRAAAWMLIVPAPLRDFGYRVVARLRHHLGRRGAACAVYPPSTQARFLGTP
jgi:predicted DCC family thiol-disulfide oxidoreductase YuxK